MVLLQRRVVAGLTTICALHCVALRCFASLSRGGASDGARADELPSTWVAVVQERTSWSFRHIRSVTEDFGPYCHDGQAEAVRLTIIRRRRRTVRAHGVARTDRRVHDHLNPSSSTERERERADTGTTPGRSPWPSLYGKRRWRGIITTFLPQCHLVSKRFPLPRNAHMRSRVASRIQTSF